MTSSLRHVEMCGSDSRMDQRGNFDMPVNGLPVKCARCTFPDLDFIAQPYFLAKGISKPSEIELAERGNFFVREKGRRVLEAVAPGQCLFFPTHDLKSKALTPWFLAVPTTLVQTATVKKSVPRCPDCGEPKVAHPGSHYESYDRGAVSQDVFKSSNWSSSEVTGEDSGWYSMHILHSILKQPVPPSKPPVPPYQWTRVCLDRELYFSIRLEILFKKLGIKGLVRILAYTEKPNADDLSWVEDKLKLLNQSEPAKQPTAKRAPGLDKWFRSFLKKNTAKGPLTVDCEPLEKKHGIELPPAYKEFASTVGEASFSDVDGKEGFDVHVVPPKKLDFRNYRKGRLEVEDEESMEVDGLMFATTVHGDCFCFDLAAPGPEYPVYLYEHELNCLEPYSQNFMGFIKRCSGE